MDDRRVEDILRESWRPEPPDGMRERVLREAREASLAKRERRGPRMVLPWRLALVGLGAAVVLVTNLADRNTELRLSEITGQKPVIGAAIVAQRPLGHWRIDIDRLLAENSTAGWAGSKGDDTP